MFFPSEAVKLEGELADYQSRGDSGTLHRAGLFLVGQPNRDVRSHPTATRSQFHKPLKDQ